MFLVLGLISSNFFGLKVLEITQSKLGANDYSKRVVGRLTSTFNPPGCFPSATEHSTE